MDRFLAYGPGQRCLIGKIAIGQGIAYLLIVALARPLTTSYLRQAEIMPLWAWGLLLAGLGGLFWRTAGQRRDMWGRLVAVAMLGIQVWLATTFAMAGALTAIGMYIPIVLVIFGEAVFVQDKR